MLNGDMLTRYGPHGGTDSPRGQGRARTLALNAVEDTSSYGVVPIAEDGQVQAFLEKSAVAAHEPGQRGRVRARARGRRGAIPGGRAVSFEREVFPELVGTGSMAWSAPGTGWTSGRRSDTSRPRGTCWRARRLAAAGARRDRVARRRELRAGGRQHRAAAVLGPHCSVGTGARVERSVLHDGVEVGADAASIAAVLGEGVPSWSGLASEPGATMGAGALIGAGGRVGAGAKI